MPNPYAPPDPSAPPPVRQRPAVPPEDSRGQHGGPGGPGRGQPGQDPQRRTPTPEEAAAAGRSVLKFGALLLVALLAMRWPIPWQVVAPVAGLGAVYLGLRALITYRKVGMAPFTMVFLMLGVGMAVLLALSSLTLLSLWDEQVTQQECTDRALTVQAEQACTDAYDQAVQERLNPSAS